MHEDIDDFEPDLNAYYSMLPEERELRKEKYYWFLKYYNGKISYGEYISGLESYFYRILDKDDYNEIKTYKQEQKIENERNKTKLYKKRKEKNVLTNNWGCVIMIIIFLIILITSLLKITI